PLPQPLQLSFGQHHAVLHCDRRYWGPDHLPRASEDAVSDAVEHTAQLQPWLKNRPAFRQDYLLTVERIWVAHARVVRVELLTVFVAAFRLLLARGFSPARFADRKSTRLNSSH